MGNSKTNLLDKKIVPNSRSGLTILFLEPPPLPFSLLAVYLFYGLQVLANLEILNTSVFATIPKTEVNFTNEGQRRAVTEICFFRISFFVICFQIFAEHRKKPPEFGTV